MENLSGSVTINGIKDQDLVKIFEIKMKHAKSLGFNPQTLQAVVDQVHPQQPYQQPYQQPQNVAGPQHYNNAVFNWQSEDGLEAIHKIISMLLKKEEHQEKSAA